MEISVIAIPQNIEWKKSLLTFTCSIYSQSYNNPNLISFSFSLFTNCINICKMEKMSNSCQQLLSL